MAMPVGSCGEDVSCLVGSSPQVLLNSATTVTTTTPMAHHTEHMQQPQYIVSCSQAFMPNSTAIPSFVVNTNPQFAVSSSPMVVSATHSLATTSAGLTSPIVSPLSKNNSKKTHIGTELSKVVQNTNLFKALQPDIQAGVKYTTNGCNINAIAQDGSVIIGCQSFKPTSTGYGLNKAQIVPVNTIVSNSAMNVLSSSSNCLTSSVCVPSASFKIGESTYTNAFNASNNNNIIVNINNVPNNMSNTSKVLPSCSGASHNKTKRNSRGKKNKKFEEESLLLQPSVVQASVSSINGALIPTKAVIQRVQNHLKSPPVNKESLLTTSSPVSASVHPNNITTNILSNGFTLPVHNASLESGSQAGQSQRGTLSAVIDLRGNASNNVIGISSNSSSIISNSNNILGIVSQPSMNTTCYNPSLISSTSGPNNVISVAAGGLLLAQPNTKQNIKQVFITPAYQEVSWLLLMSSVLGTINY